MECDGDCIDLRYDPLHCGECGTVCEAGWFCVIGDCTSVCGPGTTQCGDRCVDILNDPMHCGLCDRPCLETEVCVVGLCSSGCGPGTIRCGDRCVDPMLDPSHCGRCGSICAAEEECADGSCETRCGPGTNRCGERCVDLDIDPENCGRCDEVCREGWSCSEGECTAECARGTELCGLDCVDTRSNTAHCGECFWECAVGQFCEDGICSWACGPGTVACGEACVNPLFDPENCGACDLACADGEYCVHATCTSACGSGLTTCGDVCSDLRYDPDNCGACGVGCAPGEVCREGGCVETCGEGLVLCGDECVDTRFDPDHCGGCDSVCTDDEACVMGSCELSCGPGTEPCDRRCVDTLLDPDHCGGCGLLCDDDEYCVGGACAESCGTLALCGDTCVDVRFDPENCGDCGIGCEDDEVCNMGACAAGCGVGTVRCGDRCVDSQIDPLHCGACGNACDAEQVCRAGACALLCVGGTLNCGGSCVDILSNASHCGGCGHVCPPGEACLGGGCGMRPISDVDGDTISDFDETSFTARDTDGDGEPDYLDLDSDGDGFSDADEAGDEDVLTPPVDSDGDATPDFRDEDSDNDGLTDTEEHELETDPTDPDSDGDGETDATEIAGRTDPLDPLSCILCRGGFVFDLPFESTPRTLTLTFDPRIQHADILFLIDTTGSMGGTIAGLQSSLDALITSIREDIEDTAFGVARFDDFPTAGYGDPACRGEGDTPYGLEQRVTTVNADVAAGVDALNSPLHCGRDGPESQVEALYQAATGDGFRSPGGEVWVDPFDGSVGYFPARGHGLIGGAGFRRDSLPIIISATDITFHHHWDDGIVTDDRTTWCGATRGAACDLYNSRDFGAAADQTPKSRLETLDALESIGAMVFGLAVRDDAGTSDQRNELSAFAVHTGSYIEPDARGMCQTGVDGADLPAQEWDTDGPGPVAPRPLCPLVFSTRADGSGVGSGIVSAIEDLTDYVVFETIHTEARDDATTPELDETRFFLRGIPVSSVPAEGCAMPTITDRRPLGGDGTFDSFQDVCPGTSVTFQIVTYNDFIEPDCVDQIFSSRIIVVGDDITETDSRMVAIRVPGDTDLCSP